MKKLTSILVLLFSLSILINCSPKTAKTTAASEQSGKRDEVVAPVAVEHKHPEPETPVRDVATKRDGPTDAVLSSLSNDQLLSMYRDMAPVRLEIGMKLYMKHCNKCHDYKKPETRTAESWVRVMKSMGPKAKLNNDEHLMVGGYLVNNAKR